MKKTPKQKELEELIKTLVKKKVFYLSAGKLFARLNGFSQFHKPPVFDRDKKTKYSSHAISKALRNLEKERFIKIYSVNESRNKNKMYMVNGK